jgi:hypothetical protein
MTKDDLIPRAEALALARLLERKAKQAWSEEHAKLVHILVEELCRDIRAIPAQGGEETQTGCKHWCRSKYSYDDECSCGARATPKQEEGQK